MLNKLKVNLYKIYVKYLSFLNTFDNSKLVSQYAFKHFCDYEFDLKKPILKKNSIIFVDSKYLKEFISIAFETTHSLTAISFNCNNDNLIEYEFKKLPSNIKLFLSNVDIQYEKFKNIYPVPTGIYDPNNIFLRNGIKKLNINYLNSSKEPKILCNFNFTTNSERKDLIKAIFHNELIKYQNYLNHKNYLKEVASNMFVLCPTGNLIDTHRFWETIYCGAIPIVKKNNIYLYFQRLGIPILIVDNWAELNKLNEDKLHELYERFKDLNFRDFLTFNFWERFILEKSNK